MTNEPSLQKGFPGEVLLIRYKQKMDRLYWMLVFSLLSVTFPGLDKYSSSSLNIPYVTNQYVLRNRPFLWPV